MFQRILVLALALSLTPALALAKTPEERIQKLVSKFVVSEAEAFSAKLKPKTACVCNTVTPISPGFLVQVDNPEGQVVCAVGANFDAAGQITSFAPCNDFMVLTK